MSETFVLEVNNRDIIGKKVRQLRAQGIIPAVIYGPTHEPVQISVPWVELRPVLSAAGGTQLIDLKLNDENITTLVRAVDRHPVYQERVLHVDFYAVNLKQVITTNVPLTMVNDEETGIRITGRIVLDITSIEIETLPANIPSEIIVDVSVFQEVGDNLTVADLPQLEGVTYLLDDTTTVVRTAHFSRVEEEEEEEGEEVEEIEEGAEPELVTRRKEEFDDE